MGGKVNALDFIAPGVGSVVNSVKSGMDAAKDARRAAQSILQANQQTPQVIEDDSKTVERARRRNSLKQGRASTILAGGYQTGGAKRLLGE